MNLIDRLSSKNKDWEEINALHTKAAEQAGFDRNLFQGGSNEHRYVNVAYPEFVAPESSRREFANMHSRAIQSHSARNIRAGHINNIDHVVEHFRQQHLQEEERKLKKLAAAQQ